MPYASIFNYLVATGMIVGLSFVCCLTNRTRTFSMNTFLISCSVGIAVVAWVGLYPDWSVAFSALLIGAVLFGDRDSISEDA